MNAPPDDISWVQQSRILSFCRISRAALNSWIKSGLDIPPNTAAYGFADLVTLLVFSGARKHMTPKDMVAAWRDLVREGEDVKITTFARDLGPDDRFDLVIDPEYVAFRIARSDEELVEAVRHPTAPRPVVVVDLAERMRDAAGAFYRAASEERRPAARKRGRPRSDSRRLRAVGQEGQG
jgi:hypothetical protein